MLILEDIALTGGEHVKDLLLELLELPSAGGVLEHELVATRLELWQLARHKLRQRLLLEAVSSDRKRHRRQLDTPLRLR